MPLKREIFAFPDRQRRRPALPQSARASASASARRTSPGVVPDLVRLFPEEMSFFLETWITMHEDLRGNRRMRLVFDRLVTDMTVHAKASLGLPLIL
jgi:hypothetical protein